LQATEAMPTDKCDREIAGTAACCVSHRGYSVENSIERYAWIW